MQQQGKHKTSKQAKEIAKKTKKAHKRVNKERKHTKEQTSMSPNKQTRKGVLGGQM